MGCEGEEDWSDRTHWSGTIGRDVTWSGEITVTGDLVFRPGTTLTIEPGTVVTVLADQDDREQSHLGPVDDMTTSDPTADPEAGGEEYQRSHVSIIVQGRIESRGTPEAPIVFRSSSPTPFYTDWTGITVHEGVFEYTLVEWCVDGIYSLEDGGGLVIDHCHVRHVWAACTGFHNPADPGTVSSITHSTIEDCGHEAVDTHDPGRIEIGWNTVSASQVGLNMHDEMTAHIHNNLILDTSIAIVLVGATDVFATQNTIQSEVQDTTRWTYQGWTMPVIEQTAVFVAAGGDPHLVFTNAILFDSETGLRNEAAPGALENGWINMDGVTTPFGIHAEEGEGVTYLDPGFVDAASGDFHLRDDSPLRGAGNPADGSPDLGAYGGDGAVESIGWRYDP